MKRNILIASVAGIVILGGAMGASAFANTNQTDMITKEEVQQNGLNESNPTVKVNKLVNTDRAIEEDHITMEKAIAIAKGHTNGKVVETDFDYDDNEYEIELRTENSEVEITIDSRSGKIIKVDTDGNDDKIFRQKTNSNGKTKISLDEAIAIAIKDSPGKVTETDFDSDDNEYEIEIRANHAEIDITIDAYSGKIIEKETENYDD